MSAEPRRDYLLDVPEAVARVLADVHTLTSETMPLLGALGRVLACDVTSGLTLPAWDNSAMDGYAVRGVDLAHLPATLRVIELVAAGQFPTREVGAGEATRIMTGAPTPAGADTVVRVEDTDGGIERVEIRAARDAGKNVRPRGEDIVEGRVVMTRGTALGAAQLGVLAAVGCATVSVCRAPRVAILTSGDELVELERFDEVRAGRKIVSSNSYTLQALVREAGGEPVYHGIAADTRESLRSHLERAQGADFMITSAGVSVGEFDYVRDVLRELGADMKFWRVRMRPGAPIGFGILGGTPWIGLPGNPVSTMVTFELFARPAIRKLRGHTRPFRRPFPVRLEEPVSTSADLTHFLRAIVTHRGSQSTARLTGPQGSGILTSMSVANALLIVPRDRANVSAGEQLNALALGGDADFAEAFAL
ncbi:MAG TPA: gephyrin-like molybdotransferase Glp [Gemmatimonadaceae bacterium]|nr:gephyrin-like molybdotransferase Glp [Gemmatimonadaceae bacterium]